MAWIYFQESVESESLSANGLEQSPIVSRTDTLKAYCCPVCNRVTLTKPRSGTMSQHSMAICCQESTSSSEDSHARTSALQALEKAWKESEAVFSSRLSAWSKKSHPDSSFWKTSQPSELEAFLKSSMPLQKSGMIVDGLVYLPQALEHHISANDGFFWPTPTVCGNYQNKGNMIGIATAVRMWPTPTTQEVEHPNAILTKTGRRMSKNGKTSHSLGLADAVKMWPTPGASEYKDCGQVGSKSQVHMEKRDYLCAKVKDFTQPLGMLNPQWVEWLMGYRIGHTELNASAIAWFHCKSKRRSKS